MKAIVNMKTSKSKAGDIVEILVFQKDLDYKYAICKSSNGELEDISIGNLQIIDEPNHIGKDIQAQLILFEGQCRLNAMLTDNKQAEMDNCVYFKYNYEDFDNLQEEIKQRINELKQK